MEVRNKHGERLDVVVEGSGDTTIVFVHGMGTDKNEGSTRLLADVSAVLQKDYRIVRFDLSGYGNSEGTSEEGNLYKWADDLQAVLGISIYPRLSGDVQKIGRTYWDALRSFDTVGMLRAYAKRTSLLAIRPLEDKIIKPEPYPTDIPGVYIELPGDHNFMKREDRDTLIGKIAEFFGQ